jgi:hypothetical protein
MRDFLPLVRGLLFAMSLAILGSGLLPSSAGAAAMHPAWAEPTSATAQASDPFAEATVGHLAEPCLHACCGASGVTGCCAPGLPTESPAIRPAPLRDLHVLPAITSASEIFPDTVYKPPRLVA